MGRSAIQRPTVPRRLPTGRRRVNQGHARSRWYAPSSGLGGAQTASHAEANAKSSDTYQRWRGDGVGIHKDVAGSCKSVKTDEIASHQFALTPGRYVGAEEVGDDGEPLDEMMKRPVATREEQFAEGSRLEKAIWKNLWGVGYGG